MDENQINLITNILYIIISAIVAIFMSYTIFRFKSIDAKLNRNKIKAFAMFLIAPIFLFISLIWSAVDISGILHSEIKTEDAISFPFLIDAVVANVSVTCYSLIVNDRREVTSNIPKRMKRKKIIFRVSFLKTKHNKLKWTILCFFWIAWITLLFSISSKGSKFWISYIRIFMVALLSVITMRLYLIGQLSIFEEDNVIEISEKYIDKFIKDSLCKKHNLGHEIDNYLMKWAKKQSVSKIRNSLNLWNNLIKRRNMRNNNK